MGCSVAADSESSASGDTATLSWPHTVGAEADRILVVGVSIRDGNVSVAGVTYATQLLARVGFQNSSGNSNRVEEWYLVNPPTGVADVAVTLTNARRVVGGAASFSGVHQTVPLGTFVSDGGNSSAPSVTFSSAPGELVVDVVSSDGDALTASAGAGQIQLWNDATGSAGGDALGAASTQPGATSVTMAWTLGASKPWAIGAVPLNPAACATPTATATPTPQPTLAATATATPTAMPTATPAATPTSTPTATPTP